VKQNGKIFNYVSPYEVREKDRYLSQLLGQDWSKGSFFLLLFEQLSSMIDVTI